MPNDPIDGERTRQILSRPQSPGRKASMYLHIPFCNQICSFCGFNKSVSPEDLKEKYVEALLEEIRLYGATAQLSSMRIDAVYLGGGTPNCLTAMQLRRILEAIHAFLPIASDAEITCEGVVQNFTAERCETLRASGVNRISAGIQTFDRPIRTEHLHMRDGEEELLAGVKNMQAYFQNFNLDFIYNLPGQTDEIWGHDVDLALEMGSTHLTFYPLVLLENTAFYSDYVKSKKHQPPDEAREIAMFNYTLSRLQGSKYTESYSVRDWAIPGHSCRYIGLNARCNDIVALGAGAHGYIGDMTYRNIRNVKSYIACVMEGKFPFEAQRHASREEIMERYMVMGLRLRRLDARPFEERFGSSLFGVFGEKLNDLEEAGMLAIDRDGISFTETGEVWANNVRTYFEGSRGVNVGYADTTSIGRDGKTHYSTISRVKAGGDVEANL